MRCTSHSTTASTGGCRRALLPGLEVSMRRRRLTRRKVDRLRIGRLFGHREPVHPLAFHGPVIIAGTTRLPLVWTPGQYAGRG